MSNRYISMVRAGLIDALGQATRGRTLVPDMPSVSKGHFWANKDTDISYMEGFRAVETWVKVPVSPSSIHKVQTLMLECLRFNPEDSNDD